MMDAINHALAALLTTEWAVPAIVGLMIAGLIVIVARNYARYHRGMRRALANRLAALAPVEQVQARKAAQALFAERFDTIDAAMSAEDGAPSLVHAWLEYRDTLADDETGDALETTERPDAYFLHLGDDTRVLAWWANIFVALGLTATFLGIIAALTVTTDGLHRAGADAAGMSGALTDLLRLTAAKFWTSIGGVGVSIVLRLIDRRWHSETLHRLGRIARILERGTRHVTAQRLAAEQLRELRQQSNALTALPGRMNAGEGMAELGAALSGIAGAFEQMRGQVSSMGGALSESTHAAIDHAVSRATEESDRALTDAFSSFGERFDEITGRLIETLRTASTQMAGFAGAIDRAAGAVGGQADRLAESGERLARAAGDMAEAAAPIREATEHIDSATEATRAMLRDLDRRSGQQEASMQAVAASLVQTGDAATRAWESYRARFEDVDAALARVLEQIKAASADHAGALNAHVARIDGAFAQAVDRLAQAIDPLTDLADALEDARDRGA